MDARHALALSAVGEVVPILEDASDARSGVDDLRGMVYVALPSELQAQVGGIQPGGPNQGLAEWEEVDMQTLADALYELGAAFVILRRPECQIPSATFISLMQHQTDTGIVTRWFHWDLVGVAGRFVKLDQQHK